MLGLVHLEVYIGREASNSTSEVLVGSRRLGASTRDNERRSRLIDEDGVDLVDDGIVVATLNAQARPRDHIVAKVIEAKLRVRAIGDICLIGRLLEIEPHAVLEQAHAKAHEAVDLAHPLAIAFCQIVVDGHDVYALAFKSVEVACKRGHQRLALARLHLGDSTAM